MLELEVFDRGDKVVLEFEHSLLSLSKWEAKTGIPFLTRGPKSPKDLIDYYRDMLTSPEHDPDLVYRLSPQQLESLSTYISSTQSADSPPDSQGSRHTGEIMTSDLIYTRMVLLKIPFQPAESWHLNRLMILIAKVADAQTPPKKQSKGALLSTWERVNRKNKEYFGSEG